MYKHNGQWKFKAVGQGFNGGLSALCGHFGVDVAEEQNSSNHTGSSNHNNSNNSNNKKTALIMAAVFCSVFIVLLLAWWGYRKFSSDTQNEVSQPMSKNPVSISDIPNQQANQSSMNKGNEMLVTSYQCFHCKDIDFSETENGFRLNKPIGGSVNYVWTKEVAYDLNKTNAIKVNFDAYATGDLSENIMFSSNRAAWGENSDALTLTGWTNGTEIWGAGIRTGMFADWLASKAWSNPHLVRPDKWSHITVSLSQTKTCMFIEGKEIICSALSAGQVPLQGHIGFWVYGSGTSGVFEVKNLKIEPVSISKFNSNTPANSNAENKIYKCVDATGKKIYSSEPCQ